MKYVVCGTYREFQDYCRVHGLRCGDSSQAIFVRDGNDLRGRHKNKGDELVWWGDYHQWPNWQIEEDIRRTWEMMIPAYNSTLENPNQSIQDDQSAILRSFMRIIGREDRIS